MRILYMVCALLASTGLAFAGWTVDGVKQVEATSVSAAGQLAIVQLGTVTNGSIDTDEVVAGLTGMTLDTDPAITLGVTDCSGKVRINGDDDVIDYTLPAAQAGLVVSFGNHLYVRVITVDAAAGDIIILNDGTALDAGDATDSSGAIDDKGTFIAVDGTYWMIWGEQNTWVDGGTD